VITGRPPVAGQCSASIVPRGAADQELDPMPIRTALAVLAFATFAAACGEGQIATELPTAAASGGASLLGTVANVGPTPGDSAAIASSSGITVRVVGTSTVTSTDAAGKFALVGLPEGAVTLRFQGTDCDAALEVRGLVNGQTVTVFVRLSGSQAALQG
jgi:hypothetical protein